MKRHSIITMAFFAVAVSSLAILTQVQAASSFSESLQGFSGDSTQAGTQTAVGTAGFNFFSTAGLSGDFTSDPTIAFDASGATFGSLFGGDGGRNYMRTNESDYATVDFVAEVTFTTTDLDLQDAFFGIGAGDTALFGWPDWSTQFSSVILTPEIAGGASQLTTLVTHNDINQFVNTAAPTLGSGVNRMRLTFDAVAQTALFSVDSDYAGGAFVADATAAVVDVSDLFGQPDIYDAADYTVWRDTLGSTTDLRANWDDTGASMGIIDQADYDFWSLNFGLAESTIEGWPGEPSRIFFGGDDSVVFSDFSVTVAASTASAGSLAVPEPTTALLLLASLTSIWTGKIRR